MKINRIFAVLMLMAALALVATPAWATAYTLSEGNSVVKIDPASQWGMYQWNVDGISNLYQQWFWYRVGNSGGQQSLDALPVVVQESTSTELELLYSGGSPGQAFTIQVKYSLNAGSVGSGTSDVDEAIQIDTPSTNSSSPLNFHFFEYSDFDLAGTIPDAGVTISGFNAAGKPNTADQWDANSTLSETVTTGTHRPNRWEAGFYPNTLNSLNGGLYNLNDVVSQGAGDDTWAFQWDASIAKGGSYVISKDKSLNVFVPEPASILAFGAVLLLVGRKLKNRRAV